MYFYQALSSTWKSFNTNDKKIIKSHCLQLILNGETSLQQKITSSNVLNDMFDKLDLQFIKKQVAKVEVVTTKQTGEDEVPDILKSSDWEAFVFTNKS